jgi:predicted regulator of Ras-like GTPase activity (Roadblock/LC7/MglB family)
MSFETILREIARNCPGCIGVALMGGDGIPIAEAGGQPGDDELSLLGVEFGRVLEEARKVADAVDGGAFEELVVSMARVQVALRPVDPETFLVIALDPDGNLGKARYLMRRALPDVRAQL